ncbi:MAG TPA: PDZ domain-containing protein [Gemmataceae bacterium]|nr:PDZ domain-containing protein [Gemmataceae bacterium]
MFDSLSRLCGSNRQSTGAHRRARPIRASLEALDDRIVPAPWYVDVLGDTIEKSSVISEVPIVCPKGITVKGNAMLKVNTPSSPLKFFDPEETGLTVWQYWRNKGALKGAAPLLALPDGIQIVDLRDHSDLGAGVWIKEVRKGTPFATGLFNGDVITAVEEAKTPTKAAFRKVLRRKLAEGRPLFFTVQRGDKILEVPIPTKD